MTEPNPEAELRRLVVAVATVGSDGRRRLSCAQAFALQAEHEVPLARVGAICNEESIRITSCQLGLFR